MHFCGVVRLCRSLKTTASRLTARGKRYVPEKSVWQHAVFPRRNQTRSCLARPRRSPLFGNEARYGSSQKGLGHKILEQFIPVQAKRVNVHHFWAAGSTSEEPPFTLKPLVKGIWYVLDDVHGKGVSDKEKRSQLRSAPVAQACKTEWTTEVMGRYLHCVSSFYRCGNLETNTLCDEVLAPLLLYYTARMRYMSAEHPRTVVFVSQADSGRIRVRVVRAVGVDLPTDWWNGPPRSTSR